MFKESKYNIITKINGEDVMYNSISKSFLRVFDGFNIDDIIKSINKNSNVSEEIKLLIDNGFIVDENSIEVDNLEFLFNRNFFNNSQLNIILMPTLKCNFDCPYCFEKSYRNMKSNKNYFDILGLYSKKYFKYYKHVEISLFGGEPLLLSDKIWNKDQILRCRTRRVSPDNRRKTRCRKARIQRTAFVYKQYRRQ